MRINVNSEIGRLKAVLLHRPHKELLNLTPYLLDELLFDEIPFLDNAQKEHDMFAEIFRKNGCEVFYLEDLCAESLTDNEIRSSFIEEFVENADVTAECEKIILTEYLNSIKDNRELVLKMMEGVRKKEVDLKEPTTLSGIISKNDFFISKPLPNLYFTRDPFSFIRDGVSLNTMWSVTRRRETLFGKYIFNHHKEFKGIKKWYDRIEIPSIEGGDILVLSKDVVAIGISQRTTPVAIEKISKRLLFDENGVKTVLAMVIPNNRAFMHLDTVLTMVDKNLFTLHPEIEKTLEIYSLKLDGEKIKVTKESTDIDVVLKKYLEIDKISFIREGKGGLLDTHREQWSDGYNTLALAPREAIVYDRNTITNELLEEMGVKLHKVDSGELSRGRGGPRCMSMPLIREDL
ncbi:MAG: arginine deiminase [Parvimonas sp.]|uniref:arginine deiminase n=1 Tax=Parvimonas sp. TaxID=1944660 RepID=UPI0025DA548F|nr:arginine deiminase [Parvimonas sp.]MCI5997732.1 arginine deiminase [Parvimonas sp.]MDY3051172.1 arginine deiminase [Parvimonas sp.]